ncbi:MAG TPA: type II toxin-antitoxin system prevent-host-death family antitoxin [Thermoanaerobaculia bacterium]|nr:type II toxin-antitoxin system prevent-host-death family antitoxin [Thermoanaerobaculia bacterium]
MDKNEWRVGEAKQQFAELLRRSETEPQLIYRRNRLIAAVVGVEDVNAVPGTSRPSIADRFDEARKLFRSERYRLPQVRRKSRRDDFVRTLDAVAGGHQRPE